MAGLGEGLLTGLQAGQSFLLGKEQLKTSRLNRELTEISLANMQEDRQRQEQTRINVGTALEGGDYQGALREALMGGDNETAGLISNRITNEAANKLGWGQLGVQEYNAETSRINAETSRLQVEGQLDLAEREFELVERPKERQQIFNNVALLVQGSKDTPSFMAGLSQMAANDPRLLEELPIFKLQDNQKFIGFESFIDPNTNTEMVGMRVFNTDTGTEGPKTKNASTSSQDTVQAVTKSQFDSFVVAMAQGARFNVEELNGTVKNIVKFDDGTQAIVFEDGRVKSLGNELSDSRIRTDKENDDWIASRGTDQFDTTTTQIQRGVVDHFTNVLFDNNVLPHDIMSEVRLDLSTDTTIEALKNDYEQTLANLFNKHIAPRLTTDASLDAPPPPPPRVAGNQIPTDNAQGATPQDNLAPPEDPRAQMPKLDGGGDDKPRGSLAGDRVLPGIDNYDEVPEIDFGFGVSPGPSNPNVGSLASRSGPITSGAGNQVLPGVGNYDEIPPVEEMSIPKFFDIIPEGALENPMLQRYAKLLSEGFRKDNGLDLPGIDPIGMPDPDWQGQITPDVQDYLKFVADFYANVVAPTMPDFEARPESGKPTGAGRGRTRPPQPPPTIGNMPMPEDVPDLPPIVDKYLSNLLNLPESGKPTGAGRGRTNPSDNTPPTTGNMIMPEDVPPVPPKVEEFLNTLIISAGQGAPSELTTGTMESYENVPPMSPEVREYLGSILGMVRSRLPELPTIPEGDTPVGLGVTGQIGRYLTGIGEATRESIESIQPMPPAVTEYLNMILDMPTGNVPGYEDVPQVAPEVKQYIRKLLKLPKASKQGMSNNRLKLTFLQLLNSVGGSSSNIPGITTTSP